MDRAYVYCFKRGKVVPLKTCRRHKTCSAHAAKSAASQRTPRSVLFEERKPLLFEDRSAGGGDGGNSSDEADDYADDNEGNFDEGGANLFGDNRWSNNNNHDHNINSNSNNNDSNDGNDGNDDDADATQNHNTTIPSTPSTTSSTNNSTSAAGLDEKEVQRRRSIAALTSAFALLFNLNKRARRALESLIGFTLGEPIDISSGPVKKSTVRGQPLAMCPTPDCAHITALDDGAITTVPSCPQCKHSLGSMNKEGHFRPALGAKYFSIFDQVKVLAQNETFRRLLRWREDPAFKDLESDPTAINDVYSGQVWKDIMSKDMPEGIETLPVQLYLDSFRTNKCMKGAQHRLSSCTAFYLTFPSLPPWERHRRKHMLLLMLLPGSECGHKIQSALAVIVQELNRLAKKPEEHPPYAVVLHSLLGDSPAVCEATGVGGHSKSLPCPSCLIKPVKRATAKGGYRSIYSAGLPTPPRDPVKTREAMQGVTVDPKTKALAEQRVDPKATERERAAIEEAKQAVRAAKAKADELFKSSGINPSALADLDEFNPLEQALNYDAMHGLGLKVFQVQLDLLVEAIPSQETKNNRGHFDVLRSNCATLNATLPCELRLTLDGDLKDGFPGNLKAVSIINFVLVHSRAVFHGLVPNDMYECLCRMVTMTEAILSFRSTAESRKQLARAVESYLTKFREVFSDDKVTYYHHKLIHIHEHITQLASMMSVWCAPYEANHAFLKYLHTTTSKRYSSGSKQRELAEKYQQIFILIHGVDWEAELQGISDDDLLALRCMEDIFGPWQPKVSPQHSLRFIYDKPHLVAAAGDPRDATVEKGSHPWIKDGRWPVVLWGKQLRVDLLASNDEPAPKRGRPSKPLPPDFVPEPHVVKTQQLRQQFEQLLAEHIQKYFPENSFPQGYTICDRCEVNGVAFNSQRKTSPSAPVAELLCLDPHRKSVAPKFGMPLFFAAVDVVVDDRVHTVFLAFMSWLLQHKNTRESHRGTTAMPLVHTLKKPMHGVVDCRRLIACASLFPTASEAEGDPAEQRLFDSSYFVCRLPFHYKHRTSPTGVVRSS